MFLTWALGANFNTKFRIIGPWAFDGAEEIMKTELWSTITRRGGFFGMLSTPSQLQLLRRSTCSFSPDKLLTYHGVVRACRPFRHSYLCLRQYQFLRLDFG